MRTGHSQRVRAFLATSLAILAWAGCSDEPSGPDGGSAPPPPPEEFAPLIVSDPVGPDIVTRVQASGNSFTPVVYLSLPPGTFPEAETVQIRNLTTRDGHTATAEMIDGGFDPVGVLASVGDLLELEFLDDGSVLGRKFGTVPPRRPPTIVRTSPPPGRTDVALAVRPTVVFSEPVNPVTLSDAVRLVYQGEAVEIQLGTRPGEPWVVELVPTSALEPESSYEIEVTEGVRDLDGDALAAPLHSGFTTGTLAAPAPPPPPPPPGPTILERIAFTSTRSGTPWIYLALTSGSGVRPLVQGDAPAWSLDGRMIAFNRGSELRVINADGSGERVVTAAGYHPTWSPDGSRLAYSDGTGPGSSIRVVNLDGSGDALVLRHDFADPDGWLGRPAWWPRGEYLAVEYRRWANGSEPVGGGVYFVSLDGSYRRQLRSVGYEDTALDFRFRDPAWSRDGQSVAFTNGDPRPPEWDYTWGLGSVQADGNGLLTPVYNVRLDGPNSEGPDWSPDGRVIAYTRLGAFSASPRRIWIVSRDDFDIPFVSRQLIPEVTGPEVMPNYEDYDVAWSRVSP